MAEFRLTLLGAFTLSGVPSPALSKKAQALLAFLVVPLGQAHRRDKLASMLWSDRSEEAARQNLRQCRCRNESRTDVARRYLAAALAHAGKLAEARTVVRALLERQPNSSLARSRSGNHLRHVLDARSLCGRPAPRRLARLTPTFAAVSRTSREGHTQTFGNAAVRDLGPCFVRSPHP
jgi:hypothetical protein